MTAAGTPDDGADPETRLRDCALRGEEFDLAAGRPIDPSVASSWGAGPAIRAEVVRDLLHDGPGQVDPRGIRLRGARLFGPLDLTGLSSEVVLDLFECHLPDGMIARDARLGVVRLHRCRVEDGLAAERLVASVLAITGSVISGAGTAGAIAVPAARLGQFDCDGATVTNPSGPAIQADSLRVEFDISLRRGFTGTGTGPAGVICLLGARAARLECDGALLRNPDGPALRADSLQVDQRCFLRAGFSAYGTGPIGALRLNGARLGLFSCHGAVFRNPSGPAIVAESMQVERGAFIGPGCRADGHGEQGVVRLTGTRVGGRLHLDPDAVRNTAPGAPAAAVDGLTYAGLPEGGTVAQWLRLLGARSATYTPQPYQQLAAGCRAAGQDREAREVLVAQRKDELRRGGLSPAVRAWVRVTGWTLGYGYRPWLALAWLGGVVVAAIVVAVGLGGAGGLAHPDEGGSAPCTVVERVGVALDLSIPLLRTGARQQCEATGSAAGQWLIAAGWLLQLLGWVFATLFVAGFTGAVRRPA